MSLDYFPALIYLTTELLRRDNIRSYRYKIINWGLVLLRAGTLCASGLFIVGSKKPKATFLWPFKTQGSIFCFWNPIIGIPISEEWREKYGQVRTYHGDE